MTDDRLPPVTLVATYPPRQCGIATYTRDLRDALTRLAPNEADAPAVVALDRGSGDPAAYPPEVIRRLPRADIAAYRRVAQELNDRGTRVVSVQHEFGIFGGPAGRHVLELTDALRTPVVTTLHTVLSQPTPLPRTIVDVLIRRSARVVVLSRRARRLLIERYGAPPDRVVVVPHGVPPLAAMNRTQARQRLGLPDAPLILSFGLLGPGKRLELVVESLPAILRRVPNVRFVILGATHPEVRRRYGERYRESLVGLARRRGVARHVELIDRFADLDELGAWLQATDVFVTPYANAEQAASGTLAYAVAAGRACVSTPYEYACELLADDRGALVPFNDPGALSEEISQLLVDDDRRHAMGERARRYGEQMSWDAVARQYRAILTAAAEPRAAASVFDRARPTEARHPEARTATLAALPSVVRVHRRALDEGRWIWQHATGRLPDVRHGSCTDDVARAVMVDLLQGEELGAWTSEVSDSVRAGLRYLEEAFEPRLGRFRNQRHKSGRWLESVGSEDAHGRALQALAALGSQHRDAEVASRGRALFEAAVHPVVEFRHLRPICYATLASTSWQPDARPPAAHGILELLADRLAHWTALRSQADALIWPWPEPVVTYDNGVVPQALMAAGTMLGRDRLIARGIRLLRWLLAAQTSPEGFLAPIGNLGFWPRGGMPARIDQQPIEALSLLEASRIALLVSKDRRWAAEMERAYAWFTGRNVAGISVAIPEVGACHDGLGLDGPSANCGAESTLAWLQAVERIRELRRASGRLEVGAGRESAVGVAG